MSDNYLDGYIANAFNGITLPDSQGETGDDGAAGTDGTSLLYNNRIDFTDADNLTVQTLMTYTMDNTPTEVLDEVGDAVYIETQLEILAGVAGDIYIEFGTGNTVSTYTIEILSPLLTPTNIKLSAFVTRNSTSLDSQDIESTITIVGQPNSIQTFPVTTSNEDLAVDVVIRVRSIKTVKNGAADITCKYLKVIKYEI